MFSYEIDKLIEKLDKQAVKYTDISTKDYPKTLIIKNTPDGMVWQVYNVEKEIEAIKLSANAFNNGFLGITLEDFDKEVKETYPDWRDTKGGKEICE